MKRPRYADVYNGAFRSPSLSHYVTSTIKRFRRAPAWYINVPLYMHKMLATQRIAERHYEGGDRIDWALAVVNLMRRRAARILTQQALHFLYHPQGPWLRRAMAEYATF